MAYTYYRSITIDHTKCGSSDSSSFPVLVSISDTTLKTVANGGHIQHTTTQSAPAVTMPADLIFATTSSGATLLPWEVEFYDAVNGILVAWVQLPTVSHSTNTTFYVLYGNASVSTAQNTGSYSPQNVWDTNFKGVWHFPSSTMLSANDSTASGNNGTVNGGITAGSGKVGGAAVDDGTGYINTSPPSAAAMTHFTVSSWLYRNGAQNVNNPCVVTDVYSGNINYVIDFVGGSSTDIEGGFYAGGWHRSPSITIPNLTWTYVVLRFDGSTISLSINAGTPVTTSDSSVPATDAVGMRIGRRWDSAIYILGSIDEVRISSATRSADWILTEYNNQNAPGNIGAPNFLTYGAETGGGGGTQPYSYVAQNLSYDGSHWNCDDTSQAGKLVLMSATAWSFYTCGPASNPQTLVLAAIITATGLGAGGNATPAYPLDATGDINTSTVYRVAGTQVVGARQAAITAPSGGGTVVTAPSGGGTAVTAPSGGGTTVGAPSGGSTIDSQARTAIGYLISAVAPGTSNCVDVQARAAITSLIAAIAGTGNTVDPAARTAINALIAAVSSSGSTPDSAGRTAINAIRAALTAHGLTS